jgi:hypothetical protein
MFTLALSSNRMAQNKTSLEQMEKKKGKKKKKEIRSTRLLLA